MLNRPAPGHGTAQTSGLKRQGKVEPISYKYRHAFVENVDGGGRCGYDDSNDDESRLVVSGVLAVFVVGYFVIDDDHCFVIDYDSSTDDDTNDDMVIIGIIMMMTTTMAATMLMICRFLSYTLSLLIFSHLCKLFRNVKSSEVSVPEALSLATT